LEIYLKKALFGMIAAILLAIVMSGCSGVNSQTTNSDPAQTIRVKAAEEFTISLQANPSTGYEWQYTGLSEQIQPLSTTYEASTPVLTGSGGTDFFRFKASGTGEVVLHFVYKRSWETTTGDEKDFTVDVS
jgi:inhibitor of cysteine peptidase